MFSPEEREALRSGLLEAAKSDGRISGAAISGSASVRNEDRWSDIDLAFGVRQGSDVPAVLQEFTERMYRDHTALHHLDVVSGSWIYRVFLLENTLQVDLAFAPASGFRARAQTFKLAFGEAVEAEHLPPPLAEHLIGWAWLYALHARSSIARAKWWQAEYMISGMRDQVLALACVRHGLPAREARGADDLSDEFKNTLEEALVRALDREELIRAFRAATNALLREAKCADQELALRIGPALLALLSSAD